MRLCQENLQQLAAVRSFFQRKTVARQLLRNGAAALADMAGRQIFERCANDSQQDRSRGAHKILRPRRQ